MLEYMRKQLVDSENTQYIDRFFITTNYYDSFGMRLKEPTNAYRQVIRVIYDISARTHDINHVSEPKYFSIYGFEYDESDYYKSVIIGENERDKISSIVESYIETKCDKLEFKIEGECEVDISDKVFLKSAIFFNYVHITADNYGYVNVSFPLEKFYIKGFSFKGASLIVSDRLTINAIDYINIQDVKLLSESENPYIELLSKSVSIDGFNSDILHQIKIISTFEKNSEDFSKTKIHLDRIDLNLGRFTEQFNTPNGVFDNPLFTISSSYNLDINNVNMIGGDYLKLFKIDTVSNVNIINLYRSSKVVIGYTIGMKSVRSFSATQIYAIGEINHSKKSYVVFFDPTDCMTSDTYSIVDFSVKNVGLFNADGLKGSSISLISGTVDSKEFISTLNCDIFKISVKNVNLTLKDDTLIEGNAFDFTKVILKNDETPHSLKIIGKDGISIYDSKIFIDSKDFEIGMNDNCYLTIKNTEIQAGNFTARQTEESDPTVEAMFVNESNRKVKLEYVSFSLNGKMFIGRGVHSANFEYSKILNASSIEFSNLSKFLSTNFALDLDYKNIPIIFDNCRFGNTDIVKYRATPDTDIRFVNCSGDMIFTFKDIENETATQFNLNATVVSSKIGLSVISDIFDAKLKVKSNDSLGSCFWGSSEKVMVVPDMVSSDRLDFEITDDYRKKYDKVCYGGV